MESLFLGQILTTIKAVIYYTASLAAGERLTTPAIGCQSLKAHI